MCVCLCVSVYWKQQLGRKLGREINRKKMNRYAVNKQIKMCK